MGLVKGVWYSTSPCGEGTQEQRSGEEDSLGFVKGGWHSGKAWGGGGEPGIRWRGVALRKGVGGRRRRAWDSLEWHKRLLVRSFVHSGRRGTQERRGGEGGEAWDWAWHKRLLVRSGRRGTQERRGGGGEAGFVGGWLKWGRSVSLLCEARVFAKERLSSLGVVKVGEGCGTSLGGQGVR